MFAQLLRERPDLAPTIAKLTEDHAMMASILPRVAELARQAAESNTATLAAIGSELDGLAAIMESHFTYEERTLGKALDTAATNATPWSNQVFHFNTHPN